MVKVSFYRNEQPIVGKFVKEFVDNTHRVLNNLFAFVEDENLDEYEKTGDSSLIRVINGDTVVEVETIERLVKASSISSSE